MREAGRISAETLALLKEKVKPGVTTAELDAIAHTFITNRGAKPSFKGYRGFPKSICTSINEQVVHGIPNGKVVLKEGDIISIDVGATYKGYVGDNAITLPVGHVSPVAQRLLAMLTDDRVTSTALAQTIELDPGLTARVVGLARSAFFGYAGAVYPCATPSCACWGSRP